MGVHGAFGTHVHPLTLWASKQIRQFVQSRLVSILFPLGEEVLEPVGFAEPGQGKHGILVEQPAGGAEILRLRSASGCASLESALGPLRAAFFKIRFGAAVLEGSKKGPQTRDSPE